MSDNNHRDEPTLSVDRSGGVYRNVVSLGNVLILLGMVGTGSVGIFTVGGSVQKLQDAIEHETAVRQDSEQHMQQQIQTYQQQVNAQLAATQQTMAHDLASAQQQEANDIRSINATLGDVRQDLRTLMLRLLPGYPEANGTALPHR